MFWTPYDGGSEQYQIELRLSGPPEELDQVKNVTYRLHPGFRTPVRRSSDRANNFAISFWTWGMFMIYVSIKMKDGETNTKEYYLTYDLPADDGTNYLEVS